MLGTEYRCIVSSAQYPNDNFTRAEIEADTVSKSASLTITGGNFQVDGGLYYPTLQAALEGAGSGTHTISVVTDITDESSPVVAADQVITLDMKNKKITKTKGLVYIAGNRYAGLLNNGTLTIKNGGVIETVNNASAGYCILIANRGTLNLQGTTLRHNSNENRITYTLWNEGIFNMTSGSVEIELNNALLGTVLKDAKCITNLEGTLNISGGTVSINYKNNTSGVSNELATAIEAWDGTIYRICCKQSWFN